MFKVCKMFDTLSEDQKQKIIELELFTQSTNTALQNIVSSLGWTIETLGTSENNNEVQCPFNSAHRFPEKSLERHIAACQWKAEGYSNLDTPLSEPTLPPGAPSTLKIDEDLQENILLTAKQNNSSMISGVGDRLIPRTSDRIYTDFTSDERKAIYDYVIANTQKPDIGHDIADLNTKNENEGQKSISYLELLAQERNLKRRRAKHRGVHTNKKSHLEVMREVIEQQMEILKEYISTQSSLQDESNEQTSPNISRETRIRDPASENLKYSLDRDANFYQRIERNGRHKYKEEDKRKHYSHHSHRKDYHRIHKSDRVRSSEERNEKSHRSRDRSRNGLKHIDRSRDELRHTDRSRDKSTDRDKSRNKKRHRSKEKYRKRSKEREGVRHDDRYDKKRNKHK